MSADPVAVVQGFCDLWATGDLDAIVGHFTDDAVYHNIPMDPVQGRDAIRATIEGFIGLVDRLEFRVHHIAAVGSVVLTERIDAFVMPNRTIELPVMGTFEVTDDGRISAWRDYFDLDQFMSQLQA